MPKYDEWRADDLENRERDERPGRKTHNEHRYEPTDAADENRQPRETKKSCMRIEIRCDPHEPDAERKPDAAEKTQVAVEDDRAAEMR